MFGFSLRRHFADTSSDFSQTAAAVWCSNNRTHCLLPVVACFYLSGINTFAHISFWKHKQSCWALQSHFAMTQKRLWIVPAGSQWAQSSCGSVFTSGRPVPVSSRTPVGVGGQKEFSNPSPLYQLSIKINVRVKLCLHMRAIKFPNPCSWKSKQRNEWLWRFQGNNCTSNFFIWLLF